jgi:hypothetical protein
VGWDAPLGLSTDEGIALSAALLRDLTRPDPLSWVNRDLTRAIDHLETVPKERFADPADIYRVGSLVAQAGQIVASAERGTERKEAGR